MPTSPTPAATGSADPPASPPSLRAVLEREHHDIDGGLEDLVAAHGGVEHAVSSARTALDALRRHIYLEEELLFPPLRAAGMLAPVLVMLSEHRELWRTMDELEQRLDVGSTPAELVDLTRTLLAQLERHNAKEEPILYSQIDTALSEDARAELDDFLATGRLPDGWRCAGL
jgi:hemerythrin-like domain-containing protein